MTPIALSALEPDAGGGDNDVMRLVCFAVGLSLVAGCGEVPPSPATDAGIDGPDDPCARSALSVDEFFTCISQAACTFIEDCFGSTVDHLDCDRIPLNLFDDLAPAAARRVLDDSVAKGRAQWNPTAAAACLDVFTGGCGINKSNFDFLDTCAAIVGNVNDGAPCQADFECATAGARCVDPSGQNSNACGARVCRKPAATGQSCQDNFGQCGPGDYCVERRAASPPTATCETGAAGQACDNENDCDPGLFCNGGRDDGNVAGTCTAAKPEGSICDSDIECQGELMCIGDEGAASGFCRNTRAAGAQCDSLIGCWGGQYCARPNASQLGTCTPALGIGATCGAFGNQPWCGFTLACNGATCGEAGPIGASCTRSSEGPFATNPDSCSAGLLCTSEFNGGMPGVCEALHTVGQACMNADHCASGYCDRTTFTCNQIPLCTF